eukprot:6485529-Pyramimonas_sp.AAC.2
MPTVYSAARHHNVETSVMWRNTEPPYSPSSFREGNAPITCCIEKNGFFFLTGEPTMCGVVAAHVQIEPAGCYRAPTRHS